MLGNTKENFPQISGKIICLKEGRDRAEIKIIKDVINKLFQDKFSKKNKTTCDIFKYVEMFTHNGGKKDNASR